MKNIQDVFSSVYDWSKNLTGLFFYLKNQLIEYEYIMKITQSSISTIHQFLKTKLFKLLCSIRNELFDYQAFHELERIVNLIESKTNSISSEKMTKPYHKSIVKPFHTDETLSQRKILLHGKLFSNKSRTNLFFFRDNFLGPAKSFKN